MLAEVIPSVRLLKREGCPGYNTKLYLIVRLQFWRSKECEVPHH